MEGVIASVVRLIEQHACKDPDVWEVDDGLYLSSPSPPPKKNKKQPETRKIMKKKHPPLSKYHLQTLLLMFACLLLPKTPSNDKKQRVSRNKIPKEHFLDWPSFSIKWPMTDVSSGDLSWVNYMESERRGGEFLDE